MSTLVGALGPETIFTPAGEAAWQAWVEAARARVLSNAARLKVGRWLSVAGVLAAAGFWSNLEPYDVIIRFVLTSVAISLMFQSLESRRYPFAAVLGVLAVLYNPVGPFSGL